MISGRARRYDDGLIKFNSCTVTLRVIWLKPEARRFYDAFRALNKSPRNERQRKDGLRHFMLSNQSA
jgi:hypothetical protein